MSDCENVLDDAASLGIETSTHFLEGEVSTFDAPSLDAFCRTVSVLFGVRFASVSLINSQGQQFIGRSGFTFSATRPGIAICEVTVRGSAYEPLIICDTLKDCRFRQNPLVIGEPHLRFYAGIPIKLGQVVNGATVCIADSEPRHSFGLKERTQLADLACFIEGMINGSIDRLEADSARAQAETAYAALQQSEDRFRVISEHSSDVIILSDLDTTRRYVSPALKEMLGYTPENWVGTRPLDFVHPDDAENYRKVLVEVSAGQQDRVLTCQRYRHAAGHWVWIEILFSLVKDAHTGQPSGYIATLRDVSKRKFAEDSVRLSEARYRTLAENIPQIVCVSSAVTGEATYFNRSFDEYFGPIGLSREARLACVHPDDIQRMEALWLKAHDGMYEAEGRLRRHDGIYRWHKLVYRPIQQDGVVTGMFGTALDIDEIVKARCQIEETTALLRLAQDAASATAWDWDIAGESLRLTPESARLYGVEADKRDTSAMVSLRYGDLVDHIHPDDLPRIRAKRDKAMESLKPFDFEFRVKHPKTRGGWRWLHSFGRFVLDPRTRRPIRIAGLVLDVTDRRAVEDALRISEERLGLALDSGDDGLWDWDLVANEMWVSERWRSKLGHDGVGTLKVDATFWNRTVHPADRDNVSISFRAHLKGMTQSLACEHRLLCPDGTERWVLTRGRVAERDSSGWALRMVGTQIDISRRKEAEMRVHHMALHDALTGLPNRTLFRDRLDQTIAQSVRSCERFAVLACDLDRFKAVNDSRGHPTGDALLRVVADRMKAVLRPADTVARLGGDEFAVVLSCLDEPQSAKCLAERLINAVSEPIELAGTLLEVGLSVGLVVGGEDDTDPDEVFKRADIALYEAKAAGRGTVFEFRSEHGERMSARGQLALDMKEAIRRGDFRLVFQPVIDVRTGDVTSLEALMRWHHPIHGIVSPGDFIPLAEETGMILPLGTWALSEACRAATHWPASVRVGVNVSAIQLQRDGLETAILAALAATGLTPNRLKLEVTESVLMQDADDVLARLRRIRSMGVRIALDDFGTGYSSLSYLRRFPFDNIKIDRAFIREIADPDTAAIVRAVVSIGERLGMGIVAEGVETSQQLELVKREGCHEVQGFLFSAPLNADEARAYLNTHKRAA